MGNRLIMLKHKDFLLQFADYKNPQDIDASFGTLAAIRARCKRMEYDGCLKKIKIDGVIKYKWTGKEYNSRHKTIVSNYNEKRNALAEDINNQFLKLFTEWTWPKSIKDERYGAILERCYRLEEEGCLKRKKVDNKVYFIATGKEYSRPTPPGRYVREPVMPTNHKFASDDPYWAEKYKAQQRLISAERRGIKTNNYVSGSTLSTLG